MSKIEQNIEFLDKKRIGYKLLRETLYIISQSDKKIVLCREVFPQVAKKYGKTPESVERDIRYVLKKSGCKMSIKKFLKSVLAN